MEGKKKTTHKHGSRAWRVQARKAINHRLKRRNNLFLLRIKQSDLENLSVMNSYTKDTLKKKKGNH